MKEDSKEFPPRKERGKKQENSDVGASWQTQLYGAVQKRDAAALRDLAKQAGKERQEAAVPALCSFLLPPASRWKTPRSSKGGWPEARAAAVWALKEIGSAKALPALATTLVRDRDAMVREAARAAVLSFGSDATFTLLSLLRESINWNLKGMMALIECLPETTEAAKEQREQVHAALIQILRNEAPRAPARWKNISHPENVTISVLTIAGIVFICIGHPTSFWFYFLFVALLGNRLVAKLYSACAHEQTNSVYHRRERRHLHDRACAAISHMQDKRCIPDLIEIAFGPETRLLSSRTAVRNVLAGLLLTLQPSDTGLLPPSALEILNAALTPMLPEALIYAILHAIAAVGNDGSIKAVKRMTSRLHKEKVVEEAKRVLMILEERRILMQESRSLLRGSQSPATAAEQLLRPAASQSDAHPEQLLRPVQNECIPNTERS